MIDTAPRWYVRRTDTGHVRPGCDTCGWQGIPYRDTPRSDRLARRDARTHRCAAQKATAR